MGRLEDIAERNRNPRAAIRKMKNRRGVGLTGIVLFVVLILLAFTDLGHSPPPDPGPPSKDDSVRVKLGAPKQGGSGSGANAGSANP